MFCIVYYLLYNAKKFRIQKKNRHVFVVSLWQLCNSNYILFGGSCDRLIYKLGLLKICFTITCLYFTMACDIGN